MSEEGTQANGRLQAVHEWIVNHDDSWLFVILYIGLAVVLSIWISLFWLVAVVWVHLVFELIRQRRFFTSRRRIWGEALWELKLDVALVLFALVVSLYMDLALGVVGLQSAARAGSVARAGNVARAGLRGGARFAAWQRLIRGVMLSVDDVAQVARVVARGKAEGQPVEDSGDAPDFVGTALPSWRQGWGKGDWFAVGMALVCLALLLITPLITEHTAVSTLMTLAAELHPFPAWSAALE